MTSALLTIDVLCLLRVLRLANALRPNYILEYSREMYRGVHPMTSRRSRFFVGEAGSRLSSRCLGLLEGNTT